VLLAVLSEVFYQVVGLEVGIALDATVLVGVFFFEETAA
jgi:hypothetical protein